MNFHYKKILLIGATSGIGRALGAKFLQNNISVVAVGRRKDRLEELAQQHKSDDTNETTIDTIVFDITQLTDIPSFAQDVFTRHPDIDCIFLNSGIQRAMDWTQPATIDLSVLETEITTNYTAYLHLTKAFLPYLQQQAPRETALIYTSSGLALVPHPGLSNYSATKAALHHMLLAIRYQLSHARPKSNVKIIEIFPPAVQTELHDFEMGAKGKDLGMPLEEFVHETWMGLNAVENEQVFVQAVKGFIGGGGHEGWERQRQRVFKKAAPHMIANQKM